LSEQQHIWQFLNQKVRETTRFWRHFLYFCQLGAYFTPLTPSTTNPYLGTPLANSHHAK
jgi:hypothetical protein